jgi:hypothetical protein
MVPWLHVIAHNSALNQLRARSARETCPLDLDACVGVEDQALERRLQLRELVSAFGSLPARQRRAIVMRELEGRSYAEIADRIGASPGAVRQLLSRARISVRDRLATLLPWGSLVRLMPGSGDGIGARVGVLSDAGAATLKVCAALIPAAALGASGLSVVDHLQGGNSHRSRHAPSAARDRTTTGRSDGSATVTAPAGRPVTGLQLTAALDVGLVTGQITLGRTSRSRKSTVVKRSASSTGRAPAALRSGAYAAQPAGPAVSTSAAPHSPGGDTNQAGPAPSDANQGRVPQSGTGQGEARTGQTSATVPSSSPAGSTTATAGSGASAEPAQGNASRTASGSGPAGGRAPGADH